MSARRHQAMARRQRGSPTGSTPKTATGTPAMRRVLARRDGLAAPDRAARGRARPTSSTIDRVGRDREPDQRRGRRAIEARIEPPNSFGAGDALAITRRSRRRGSGASISAPRSVTLRSPTIVSAVDGHRRRRSPRPRRRACWVSARTAAWRVPVATQASHASDVEAGGRRDGAQPGRRERSLVLAGLVGEHPVLDTANSGPGRRHSARRAPASTDSS